MTTLRPALAESKKVVVPPYAKKAAPCAFKMLLSPAVAAPKNLVLPPGAKSAVPPWFVIEAPFADDVSRKLVVPDDPLPAVAPWFTIIAVPAVACPPKLNPPPLPAPNAVFVAVPKFVMRAAPAVELPTNETNAAFAPATSAPWLLIVALAAVELSQKTISPPCALLFACPPKFVMSALPAVALLKNEVLATVFTFESVEPNCRIVALPAEAAFKKTSLPP